MSQRRADVARARTPEPKPPFLDFDAAAEEMKEMGLKVTPRQVRRYADTGRLPFRKALDGRRYISKAVLEHELIRIMA